MAKRPYRLIENGLYRLLRELRTNGGEIFTQGTIMRYSHHGAGLYTFLSHGEVKHRQISLRKPYTSFKPVSAPT